jgi:hypothetical protein
MLRVSGGMRSLSSLVGLLLTLMLIQLPASANNEQTPLLDLELVLWRASDEISTVEREWPQYVKDTRRICPLEAANNKRRAGPAYAARTEELKRQQPAAVTPSTLKIPTIQLLDCRTLTEEEVCKGLMCTWEEARCHETAGNAGSTAAPPGEGPPR